MADHDTALLFVVLLPGNTAIAMFPDPAARGIVSDDQQRLLTEGVKLLRDRELYYLQVLVETQAVGRRRLLEATGFRHLNAINLSAARGDVSVGRAAATARGRLGSRTTQRITMHSRAWFRRLTAIVWIARS